jgi:DNA-binding HxlR family transcriptional regulator
VGGELLSGIFNVDIFIWCMVDFPFHLLFILIFKTMKNLNIINPHFITYSDELLTVDVLGGVDTAQVERMFCTLRIGYKNYPPMRSTLDLYNDTQTEKLIRSVCDKYELKLNDASKSVHSLILQLEEYRIKQLKYSSAKTAKTFIPTEAEKQNAVKTLKKKNLLQIIIENLNATGIVGEDENALILFLSLASHRSLNPFSVLCLAKSGIGKSYILQKLTQCMPDGSYSFHTQISENALYYFNSDELQNKALLIEDLDWTQQMLSPLATLQSHGKLVKTRATKDKDGMLHSTTFEVTGNLCMAACAYSDKNYEELSLPFLTLNLNHSPAQDIEIMDYQKRCKAGLVRSDETDKIQHDLKCIMDALEPVNVINPYAQLINLPADVGHPRKSFLLLLNFIELITFFFQHQREKTVDKSTGEIFVKTHPDDIETAFHFLKNNLFRRADELSSSARGFYHWLTQYLKESKTDRFSALDVRRAKRLHPRTLNRYLNELKFFSYIQVAGGNQYREGFLYKLTQMGDQSDTQSRIENDLKATTEKVKAEYEKQSKTVRQNSVSDAKTKTA